MGKNGSTIGGCARHPWGENVCVAAHRAPHCCGSHDEDDSDVSKIYAGRHFVVLLTAWLYLRPVRVAVCSFSPFSVSA